MAVVGSLRWLSEQFFASAEFLGLDITTRASRRNVLATIWAEPIDPAAPDFRMDKIPFVKIQSAHIRGLRDRKRDAPEAANNRVKVLRGLFKWALANDEIMRRFPMPSNPARDVPGLKNHSDGFHTWTVEEVEQFERYHPEGSTARRALALLMFTAQRKSDIIKLGRQHIRHEQDSRTGRKRSWFHFTQHKNRKRKPVVLDLPILPDLEAELARCSATDLTFIVNEYGKPFTEGGFGNRMRKWCDDAGLPHCSAHGVRKAAACLAAENGATGAQMDAIFGWRDAKMASHYSRKARQKLIAGDAMHLIQRRQGEKSLPLLDWNGDG